MIYALFLHLSTAALFIAAEMGSLPHHKIIHRIVSHHKIIQLEGNSIVGNPTTATTYPTTNTGNRTTTRPHVTLSFAQSLDGKLAPFIEQGKEDNIFAKRNITVSNYALSGPESLEMTHALRSIHDGILVGGQTLSIDNPRLTNRLWELPQYHNSKQKQPRPIVLDSTLRHVRKRLRELRATNLLVFCSEASFQQELKLKDEQQENLLNERNLELVPCGTVSNSRLLDLSNVLRILRNRYEMRSVMVEGGAQILSSFLGQGLFDSLCITIAPSWIGPGVGLSLPFSVCPLHHRPVFYEQLGQDCVMYYVNRVDCNWNN